MRRLVLGHSTETTLIAGMVLLCVGLSFGTDRFLTVANAFDVLNISAVNIIFAVGLLVVLISGGIDISFAVAASVAQYLTVLALGALGGGNWAEGFLIAGVVGTGLGLINAFLIYRLQIISIVATISTFNIFFGLLMFFTKGVSIYNLPDWLSNRVVFYEHEMADGSWVELTLPVVVMILCCVATSFMISRTT
ncbi:MAG: ABC transporter permease, partial [Oxalobacteraceae bacterium]